jgi:hypothetical protein
MTLEDKTKKATTVLTGAAALAATIKAEYNEQHGEYDKVTIAGIPVFKRDERGNPKLLGIPFGRWVRGPRKCRRRSPCAASRCPCPSTSSAGSSATG